MPEHSAQDEIGEVKAHQILSEKRAQDALDEMHRLESEQAARREADDLRRSADDSRRQVDDVRRQVDDVRREADDKRRCRGQKK